VSVVWSLRARRFEEKLQLGKAGKIVRECWMKKKQYGWKEKDR